MSDLSVETKPKKKSGRPRKDDRRIMSGILYVLLTGCQWKALPRFYGAPSTVHEGSLLRIFIKK